MKITPIALLLLLQLGSAASAGDAAAVSACSARSAATLPTVVELYTSEGCNSCPPADRWLSGLKSTRPDVIAVAFHVDYWDRLGWTDRFASAAYTARQQQTLAHSGARFAYTPQIIVNGRDWRGSSLPAASKAPASVSLTLQRLDAGHVGVEMAVLPGAPAQLQLWWASVEDGHQSNVKAGENSGVTLKHDDVVRQYAQLPAGQNRLTIAAPAQGDKPRRLVVVAVDGATGQVVQAAELGC